MKTPIALFLLLPALLLAQSNGNRQPAPLVLAHVTIIDVTGGPSKPDMTVVIREDRISDIGKAGEMPVPPDATVVDASGKFLIPGLWDMHVHWYNRDSLTLFTANGVTGVREMFGNSDLSVATGFTFKVLLLEMELTISLLLFAALITHGIREVIKDAPNRRRCKVLKRLGLDLIPREGWGGIGHSWPKGEKYRVCRIVGWNQTGHIIQYYPGTRGYHSRDWRKWPKLDDCSTGFFATLEEVDAYLLKQSK